jgi:hypothetical protein
MAEQIALMLPCIRTLIVERHGNRVVVRISTGANRPDQCWMEMTPREADLFAGHLTATVTEIVNAERRR